MTVVPLIVSLLVVAVAGSSPGGAGRLGLRALAMFAALSGVVATIAALIVPQLWGGLRLDPADTAALLANSTDLPAGGVLTLRDWLVSLVPGNAVKAAADGAILPLLLFTLVFAAALGRLPAATAAPVIGFFKGVGETMMIVVEWVLLLSPLGVFGLAAVIGAKLGGGAAAALLMFFGLSALAYLVVALALYALAPLGGVSMARFARAALPVQLIGFAARSSVAALPSMITVARDELGVSTSVRAFVLPLAAATFKLQSAVSALMGVCFVAFLYGLHLSTGQIIFASVYGVLVSLSTPGVTGAGLLMQVPLYQTLGLPVEGLALILAIDTLPDMFKTVLNVTADLIAVLLLDHHAAVLDEDPCDLPSAPV
jgi:Na+/H+-dicarboxylate symporter